jgi:hypothetical protein
VDPQRGDRGRWGVDTSSGIGALYDGTRRPDWDHFTQPAHRRCGDR